MAPGLTLNKNNNIPQEMIISREDLIPMALPVSPAPKKEAREKTGNVSMEIDLNQPVGSNGAIVTDQVDETHVENKVPKSTDDSTAIVGMDCDIKNLYQKEDDRGRCTWTDKYPDNLEEAAENEATARYAILVRNKKSYDSRKKLEIDSIVIQSPLLKNALSKILKDYPGKSAWSFRSRKYLNALTVMKESHLL